MDACTENFVKFGHVAFEIRNGLTDTQTEIQAVTQIHRHAHRNMSQPYGVGVPSKKTTLEMWANAQT